MHFILRLSAILLKDATKEKLDKRYEILLGQKKWLTIEQLILKMVMLTWKILEKNLSFKNKSAWATGDPADLKLSTEANFSQFFFFYSLLHLGVICRIERMTAKASKDYAEYYAERTWR